MASPVGIAAARKKAVEGIAARYGLTLCYLFGSQADLGLAYLTGQDVVIDDPLADLDIGVLLSADHSADVSDPLQRAYLYGDLANAMQELFTPFNVDLVLLNETHSVFQAEAICGHCIYAVSDAVKDDYELRTLARAADFRPVLEMFYRERLEDV